MCVDLNGIEAWTRQLLEAEARRRNIRDPEFRGRTELIRLLIRDEYGDVITKGRERVAVGVRTFEQARSLASVALDAVVDGAPGPLEAFMRLRSRMSLNDEPSPPPPPYSPPQSTRQKVQATTAVEVPAPQVEAEEDAVATEAAAAAEVSVEAAAEAEVITAAASQDSAHARPQWPVPPPPVPEAPVTRAFTEEPIRTHSMARLLAGQGHRDRALAIYEELLAQQSNDGELKREMQELRAQAKGEPLERELPAPPMPGSTSSDDEIVCERRDTAGIALRWHVTRQGIERARQVLGEDGEFAVRVVAIVPDPEQVVRSDISEHGPVESSGQWQAAPIDGSARCLAAIGLRNSGASRFVSIAHVKPT